MKKTFCAFAILAVSGAASAASETTQYSCVHKEQKLSFSIKQVSSDDKTFGYKLVVKELTDPKDPYSEIFTTERLKSEYDSSTRELVWKGIGFKILLKLGSPNSDRFDAVNGEVSVDGNAAIPDIYSRDNYISIPNESAICYLEGRRP